MIELVRSEDFDFGCVEYRDLFEHSTATAFQRPEWLMAFYRHLGNRPGSRGMVILGYSYETRGLQLALPLLLKNVGEKLIIEYAYADVTDYVCPVVHADLLASLEQYSSLPDRINEILGPHDALLIKPVRECDCGLWQSLFNLEPEMLAYGRHQVAPYQPFNTWRDQNFGRARRSQLDRKIRRLARRGELRLDVLDPGETEEAIEWAGRTRRGRFSCDPIQRPDTLHFYRDIASMCTDPEFTRTYRLVCGNDTVAVCFGLVEGARFCYLVLACDYQNFAACSPGIIILDFVIADWFESGGKVFDFTIGDEPYKSDFRCERSPMYELRCDSVDPV